jgi:hypothetical protein
VAGFTGALHDEFAIRSRIAVCAVYPTFVNTPTDKHSANYTGRSLRPLPPLIEPEHVAERIVRLALRPRRAVHFGAQHALASVAMTAPEGTDRIAARLPQSFLFRSGPPAAVADGLMFAPRAEGTGTRGGWGKLEQQRRVRAQSIGAVGPGGLSTLFLARGVRTIRRSWERVA